jgi:serine/threonine protein kinase
MTIQKFDPRSEYTPKMIFAGYMNRPDLMYFIKKQKNKEKELTKLYDCLGEKLNINNHKYYGYIISTRVGKSCDKLTTDDINKKNIKQVLTSYSKEIRNFINNLYEKQYVHGDIKTPNMTLKDNKIYFIDFGFTGEYDNILEGDPIILGRSLNYNYPIILHLFSILYFSKELSFATTKSKYLTLFNDIINNLEKNKQLYNVVSTLILSHPYSIFKNIDAVKTYLKKYIKQLLDDNLDDNEFYNINDVYEICFRPIAKNVDIYSLSLVMFHLFYNNIYQPSITLSNYVSVETLKLISDLFNDALYNQIENPINLADRLDDIIKTIP